MYVPLLRAVLLAFPKVLRLEYKRVRHSYKTVGTTAPPPLPHNTVKGERLEKGPAPWCWWPRAKGPFPIECLALQTSHKPHTHSEQTKAFPGSGMPQTCCRTHRPEDPYKRMQSFSRWKEEKWVGHEKEGGMEEKDERKGVRKSITLPLYLRFLN